MRVESKDDGGGGAAAAFDALGAVVMRGERGAVVPQSPSAKLGREVLVLSVGECGAYM